MDGGVGARKRGIRRINLRLAPDVAAMLNEMATGIRDVTPTISEAIRVLHATRARKK